MNIYKLIYQNKETAIADLITKGVYLETEEGISFGQGVHAVVDIGLIELNHAQYDNEGNETTPPIYVDGYHFDIMTENVIDFGANRIHPNNSRYSFLGFDPLLTNR